MQVLGFANAASFTTIAQARSRARAAKERKYED
jgi:hypothetical protein